MRMSPTSTKAAWHSTFGNVNGSSAAGMPRLTSQAAIHALARSSAGQPVRWMPIAANSAIRPRSDSAVMFSCMGLLDSR